MISAIYTMDGRYRDKKIYIWNINADSIELFTMAAFRMIDICGFVTPEERHAGERYMNRPIVTIERLEQDTDHIVLVSDNVPRERMCMSSGINAVYWADILIFNEELREKKVIIYGTGIGAQKIRQALKENGVEESFYCVTKKDGNERFNGKPVIEAACLVDHEDSAVILGARAVRSRYEMLENLSDFQGQIYMELEHLEYEKNSALLDLLHVMLVQNIALAVRQHRDIYIYNSRKNAITDLIQTVLGIYGIHISGFLSDTADKGQGIRSVYEAAYEGTSDKLVIIAEEFPERLAAARENIESAGFSLEKNGYTALKDIFISNDQMMGRLRQHKDPLVGGSIIYPDGKPGWKVYGKEEKDRIRIVVTGGSTSAEVFHTENWVSRLYYRSLRDGIRTTIYNGAHVGNDIVSEILRFLRDGAVLRPHIVISMSGVNNTIYKRVPNQFNEQRLIQWVENWTGDRGYCAGVPEDVTLYSFWERNVRSFKAIAEFHGAQFFGFLQPIDLLMRDKSAQETSWFEKEERVRAYRDFAELADGGGKDHIDLLHCFEHQEGMYIDICHYTDKGHQALADRVYDAILPTLQALRSEKEH